MCAVVSGSELTAELSPVMCCEGGASMNPTCLSSTSHRCSIGWRSGEFGGQHPKFVVMLLKPVPNHCALSCFLAATFLQCACLSIPENAYGSVAFVRGAGWTCRGLPCFHYGPVWSSVCVSGAQLAQMFKMELALPLHCTALSSDSTTVLTWIHSETCCYLIFVDKWICYWTGSMCPPAWTQPMMKEATGAGSSLFLGHRTIFFIHASAIRSVAHAASQSSRGSHLWVREMHEYYFPLCKEGCKLVDMSRLSNCVCFLLQSSLPVEEILALYSCKPAASFPSHQSEVQRVPFNVFFYFLLK